MLSLYRTLLDWAVQTSCELQTVSAARENDTWKRQRENQRMSMRIDLGLELL